MICFAALMDGDGFWASEEGLALLDATLAGLAAIPAVRLVAAASHPGIGAVAGKHAEVFVPVEPDVEADQAVRNAWATVREKLPEGEPVALVDVRNPAAPAILSDALSLSDGGALLPLAAVSDYEDHPCQYFRKHAVVDMFRVDLRRNGMAELVDISGTRLMPVETSERTVTLPLLRAGAGPGTVAAVPFDETRLYPEHAFQQDITPDDERVELPCRPEWTGYTVLVTSTATCHLPTIREWFEGEGIPWEVRQVKNTDQCAVFTPDGEKISGRQLFPDIRQCTGQLLVAEQDDVSRYLDGAPMEVLSRCRPFVLSDDRAHVIRDAFDHLEYLVAKGATMLFRELREALDVLDERVGQARAETFPVSLCLSTEQQMQRIDGLFSSYFNLFEELGRTFSKPRESETQVSMRMAQAFTLSSSACSSLFTRYQETRCAYFLDRAGHALAMGDIGEATRSLEAVLEVDSGNARAHGLLNEIIKADG